MDITIFTDASTPELGCPFEEFPDFVHLGSYRLQATYPLFGTQGGSVCCAPLGSSAQGPPGNEAGGNH